MFGSLDLDEKLSMKQYVALRKDHRSLRTWAWEEWIQIRGLPDLSLWKPDQTLQIISSLACQQYCFGTLNCQEQQGIVAAIPPGLKARRIRQLE